MKIDCHIHALPERSIALLRRDPVYRVTLDGMKWHGGNYPDFEITPKWFDPDTALAGMKKNGIDMGIMSAAPKPLFYYEVDLEPAVAMCRETNLGLAEFQQAHPKNFRWMAHLPLRFPKAAVDMLDEAVAAGCCGVIAGTSIAGRRLDEPDYEIFWSAVENARHAGAAASGLRARQPRHGRLLSRLGDRHADRRHHRAGAADLQRHARPPSQGAIISALGGGFFPYQVGRLRQCISYRPELKHVKKDPWDYVGQIKFDTNVHENASLKFLIEFAGAENVLLGTDLPFSTAIEDPFGMLDAAAGGEARDPADFRNRARRLLQAGLRQARSTAP